MIKAEFLAKEYIKEQKNSSESDFKKLSNGFERLNKDCIKGTNGSLFIKIMIKVAIFNVLALIF